MDQQAALRWVQANIAHVRRRPAQRHHRGAVGRRRGRARPPGLARLARALPAGHRGERRVRPEPGVARRRRGLRHGLRRERGMPGPNGDVPASRAGPEARRHVPGRRDPGSRRRKGPHGVDRDGARRRALRPRADHQRHQPRRGAALRPGPPRGREWRNVRRRHRRRPRRPTRARSPLCSACRTPRAAAVAAEYPLASYDSPVAALSTLVADANFACPALQVDRWTSKRVPTFAYQFNDDSAPQRFAPPGALMPPIATHSSEIQYLFDQPNTPVPATLDADQERLAATHANGLGDVRRVRQPVDESGAVAVVQRRLGRAVARVAAATGSSRASPRHTTARSGPPDDVTTAELSPWRPTSDPSSPGAAAPRRIPPRPGPLDGARRSSSPPGS